jgi:hypothetical protein
MMIYDRCRRIGKNMVFIIGGLTMAKLKLKLLLVCALVFLMSAAPVAVGDWDPGDAHKMHYPQLPKQGGWDVATNSSPGTILADDWQCSETGPATGIHFWTSWRNNLVSTVDRFRISIYSDRPDPDGPGPEYSEPNELLWGPVEFRGDQGDFTVRSMPPDLQGWFDMWNPENVIPQDHNRWCQINITDINNPFIQQEGNIYWLAISDLEVNAPGAELGWKESDQNFNDDAVYGIIPYGWEELIDPCTGTSMDLAFVITGRREEVVKWEQMPDETWTGIDIRCDRGDGIPRVLADDFLCETAGAISKIMFWGSWKWDDKGEIEMIHVSIHADDPCGPNGWSQPAEPLWAKDFFAGEFKETLYGNLFDYEWFWDPAGGEWPISYCDQQLWQYEISIDPCEAFIQQGSFSDPVVYWLDIFVLLDPNYEGTEFGWKTSVDHWNDDAVDSNDGGYAWYELQYPLEHPYYPNSIDLAFVIFTTEGEPNLAEVKWIQEPDLYETGIDVDAAYCGMVADDFECTKTGLITDVHIWASWYYDELPFEDPTAVSFTLSIYSDNPVGLNGWSEPNELLWTQDFESGVSDVRVFADYLNEGWYWPCDEWYEAFADSVCWQYDFYIDPCEAFLQRGDPCDPVVYWVAVQAFPDDPMRSFGWKTSLDHWNDDAVWSDDGIWWEELRYPVEHPFYGESIDLAFAITTEPQQPVAKEPVPHLKWSQPPIEIDPDIYETPIYCGWDEPSYISEIPTSTSVPVYENWDLTGLGFPVVPGPNLIADDMTLAGTQREFSHYDFSVYAPNGTAPYNVLSELYTEVIDPCTGLGYPDAPIPGTSCVHGVNSDGYVTLSCAPGPAVILPDHPWMVLLFSDVNVGWWLGEEAERGFTNPWFGLGRPWNLYWWGGDPHAGFEANIWCESEEVIASGIVIADDFRCLGTMPVASVHWWGSYLGWEEAEPPLEVPTAWRIGFWSNVPADPNREPNYSYPDELLWQIKVDAERVDCNWVGHDQYPMMMPEACFQYYVDLEPEEYFWQNNYTDSTQGDVFWLSIAAIYDTCDVGPANPWGWKTRPWSWMDDAVRFLVDEILELGMVLDPWSVEPIEDPMYGESFDVAFELDTDPNYIKWEQAFTGIRHWEHYEDELSIAEVEPNGEPNIMRLVADDWRCHNNTSVTAAAWWGSYLGYGYEACQGPPADQPVKPDYFELRIWDDVPDPNPADPNTYSHPGNIIWEYKAYDYDQVLVGYDKHPHGEPNEPVFRYSVRLPREDWFSQEYVDDIYWFSVVAVYDQHEPTYDWGWTNHEHEFNDNAVSGYVDPSGTWIWDELYDQTSQSEDMSFILFTEPDCLNITATEYADWILWGRPKCWCYPWQCRGDIDGKQTGPFHVAIPDLGLFKPCFNRVVLPPGCICADLDHMQTGPFRVAIPDLAIFKTYFNQFVVPQCDQPPVYTGPYNYWTSP